MRKILIILIAWLLVMPLAGFAGPAAQDIADSVSDAAGVLVGEGKAKGAVLSIVADGRMILSCGFGFADAHNGIAADPEKTAFRIGSVSKTFVAVAAMVAVQEGRLDLHADIAQYLGGDCPKLLYPVTMEQLLTHTAGFEDMVTGMAVKNVSDTEPLSLTVHKYLPKQVFKPGEVSAYSNYSFALAAYVVEKAMGQDFGDFCRERIFLPLAMNHTTFAYMHDVAYISKPYLPDGRETLEPYMNLYPEGSAISTAADMAAYMCWLMDQSDGRVLAAASKEMLFAQHFSMSEDLSGLGLGFNRKERNGLLYFDKKGETLNFYSRIALYPQKGMGVFLSYNTYLPEEEINAVMLKALDLIYGSAPRGTPARPGVDIGGMYASNWSAFTTAEKMLRYVIPGKLIRIEGNLENGFTLGGRQMLPIGDDLYATPMGKMKFIHQNGTVTIATETAVTYEKIPVWQQPILQGLVPLFFLLVTLSLFVREAIGSIRKINRADGLLLVISGAQLIFLGVMIYFLFTGITSFSLLNYWLPISLCGWLMLLLTVFGIVYVEHTRMKRRQFLLLPSVWTLAGILYGAWMGWMNLL